MSKQIIQSKSLVKQYFSICLLLATVIFFSGCRCSPLEGGRRPQVLPDPVCEIIDYDCSCDLWSDSSCGPPLSESLHDNGDAKYQYHLITGDVLEISSLLGDGNPVETAVVAPDGQLYYSVLDGFPAAGRTVDDVADEIQAKLEKFYLKPVVTAIPQVATGHIFKILGRVRFPGVYPIESELHVREAIALAGDLMTESYSDKSPSGELNPLADLRNSYIMRDGKRMDVDFEKLLFDPTYHNNILVRAGDFIYIAPMENYSVYILGAVSAPGRFIWRRDQTFMDVLATAGGWGYGSPLGANLRSVLLIRGPLENPCAICIDATRILDGSARDLFLQPGDIIYVHNKTMRFGRALIRIALDSFIQSFATGVGSYYAGVQWMRFPIADTNTTTVP